MNAPPPALAPLPFEPAKGPGPSLSPAGAISFALDDTLRLLFRPFDLWNWAKLSLLCLFLGGGTPTAALQWSLSALPGDLRLPTLLGRVRQFVEQHPSLIFLVIVVALGLGLCVVYLRSVFRFILVDMLVSGKLSFARAWAAYRPLGESYFRWLAGTLGGLLLAFSLIVIVALPGLQAASLSGADRLFVTASLALILSLVAILGLASVVLITLTDDLVVPLMYADRLPLASAWRALWRKMRSDPTSFTLYIVLRFLLSVGVSVAVLLFLVPLLVGLFSGAVIIAAVAVLALHWMGLAWVWKLSTVGLALAASLILSAALLVLLSVVGMPGQVFLQDFSLRFIAARSTSLEALYSAATGESRVP